MTRTLTLIARLVAELDAERRGAQFLAAEVERAWRDGVAEGMRRAQASSTPGSRPVVAGTTFTGSPRADREGG